MNDFWNTYLTDLNNFQRFTPFHLLLGISVIIIFIIAIVYYFKNAKLYNKYDAPIFFVMLIIFTVASYMYINRAQKLADLKGDYAIAIGKIDKYTVSIPNKGSGTTTCDFSYTINEEIYFNQNSSNPYTTLPNKKPNLEIDYLVIYEKSKPINSYILLNYRIKDSLDFLKFRAEFKKGIPENVFRD